MDYQNTRYCDKCFSQLQPEDVSCPVCGWDPSQPQPASSTLPTGTILLGKYAVGRVLGKGGFGVTYLAFDLSRAERVAIKEYMPDTLSYRMPGTTPISTYFGEKEQNFHLGAEKFYEEAHTLSRFSGNPNITRVHEFFYENNTAYFVMEYIQGSDLKAFIAQNGGRLGEHAVLSLLWPLLGALEAVHAQGILHRDISPDNIFITDGGIVKLLDFGSARQVLGEQSKSLSVVLKPGFAPVEQYQTHGRQGEWTDVYALAATAYYCLTGRVPESAMDRVVEDTLEPPSVLGAEVSSAFEEVLLQAMSVRATGRIQNIPELRDALLRAVPDAAPQAKPAVEESAEPPAESIPAEGGAAEQELSAEPQGENTDASPGAIAAFLRFFGTARERFAEFWASSALHKTEVCGAAAVVLTGIIVAVVFAAHSPIQSVPAAAMSSRAVAAGGGGTEAASAVSQSISSVSPDTGISSAVSSASATASSSASSSKTVVQQNQPSSKTGNQITVTSSPSPNDKPSSAPSPDPIYSQPQEASSAPPPAKNEYNNEFPDYLPDAIDIGIAHAEYSSTGMTVNLLVYNNTDSPKKIQLIRITLCKSFTNNQPVDIILDNWLPSIDAFTIPAHGSVRRTCDLPADCVKVWNADLWSIVYSLEYYA